MDIGKYSFALRTDNSFGLPDFKGSTFRGKFGHVLKRTICVMSVRDCQSCKLQDSCAYTYLFESRNGRGEEVSRPFVLEPPLTHKRFFLKDEPLFMNLILIGKAREYLPYFVYVFYRMGQEGIGQDRGRFTLSAVNSFDASGNLKEIFNQQTKQLKLTDDEINLDSFNSQILPQITINFLTPVQIKKQGRIVDELPFSLLLKSILRRYRSLEYFHNNGNQERFDINWEAADQVQTVYQDLEIKKLKRYSNRQKKPIPLQGLTGRITYRGDLGQFYPWLKIGEYLHVGKGAVFGLGWYRVVN